MAVNQSPKVSWLPGTAKGLQEHKYLIMNIAVEYAASPEGIMPVFSRLIFTADSKRPNSPG